MSKYFFAVGAAMCFGIATALQHRAARAVPVAGVSPIRLILRLFRNRLWLVGRVADTAAVILQALALRLGSLVAIQSIVTCGVVAAIVLSSALDRRLPRRNEVVGSAVVVLGAVMVGAITHPNVAATNPSFTQWAETAAMLASVLLCAGAMVRSKQRLVAPSLALGISAGACFAVGSALLKIGSLDFRHHGLAADTIVALALFAAVGLGGNVIVQRSFQLGEISVGLPALVATEPIAALAVGSILFHEDVATGPRGLVGLAGLAVLALGIATLSQQGDARVNLATAPLGAPEAGT